MSFDPSGTSDPYTEHHTHTHSFTHTHTHSFTYTQHTVTHTHSLTLTHTHAHSLTLTHSHQYSRANGVRSEITIFLDKHPTCQLQYKLAERCCNNQAQQLAMAKALEEMKDLYHLQGNQRSLAIHTDSRTPLGAIANTIKTQ